VTWVVPLALGGVAILVMAVFTMVSARKRHRSIVAPAAVVGPRILIHDINDDRCTGCDACVAVCPTNVLDLVANKSRVLRFQDCIQCEACMFACPTEALVMFPEGGSPPALKVPEIDESFQTAIPGQYLIGEVAGKPLVKNAANLGRTVVEHMLASGMQPGAIGRADNVVDVAIVGSGPGGLSAALTCIQRGLSYVVLEKEQLLASTIARYPKGKLVMAEPYDVQNLSFLPVFDSGKEQLLPIWRELIERTGVTINQGESVETVSRSTDGTFEVRSTVASYRAQRVVLSIGTRGKPRTLQVQGENLPKVFNLLEDPDEWRGKAVLVIGGGDSACEAALALADAGAKVMISYRGKGFNRAAPKNKQAIEGYAGQGRVKAKLGSQVLSFEPDSVTLALGDGSQKRYPNDAAFVLIGADPPVAWLEKMGVRFIERPHQYQMGKTDEVLRRLVPSAMECPEDAQRAAAQVLGGSIGVEPPRQASAVAVLPMPMGEPVSGPRKWLRSATSIFSTRGHTGGHMIPPPKPDTRTQRGKKLDAPMPLSEFARRGKSGSHSHSGHGRRDSLTAGERTRILRMLRDEGGRLADEESQILMAAPRRDRDFDFDFDDSPAPAPVAPRPDIPAKPAVVVGLAQAQAARNKRTSERIAPQPPLTLQSRAPAPPPPPPARSRPPSSAPPVPTRGAGAPVPTPRGLSAPVPTPRGLSAPVPTPRGLSAPVPTPRGVGAPVPTPRGVGAPPPSPRTLAGPVPTPRRSVPAPFGDEPTRQVDDALLSALRNAPPAKAAPKPNPLGPALPRPGAVRPARPDDITRLGHVDSFGLEDPDGELDAEMTRPSDDFPPRYLSPQTTLPNIGPVEDHRDPEEATRLASLEGIAAMERARNHGHGPGNEERTRAVNIRNDPSISDIDWDLD
jgi:thioredoxin reductase (NADPH)